MDKDFLWQIRMLLDMVFLGLLISISSWLIVYPIEKFIAIVIILLTYIVNKLTSK